MAKYETLPIFGKTYDLTIKIYELCSNLNNNLKHSLGENLKKNSLLLLREIYRINRSKDKKACFERFLDHFELVKLEIRLCFDMKGINSKKHSELSLLMNDIGKQINGWKRKSENND